MFFLQGPYDIDIKSFQILNGPKQKTITAVNFSLVKRHGDYFGLFNVTFLGHGRMEEVRNNNNI